LPDIVIPNYDQRKNGPLAEDEEDKKKEIEEERKRSD